MVDLICILPKGGKAGRGWRWLQGGTGVARPRARGNPAAATGWLCSSPARHRCFEPVRAATQEGQTALCIAARKGHMAAATELLDFGANLETVGLVRLAAFRPHAMQSDD